MKRVIHRNFLYICYISLLLSCTYVTQLSPAAEVLVGNLCWYTCDTILKLWSSGFIGSLQHRVNDLKRRDELLHDFVTYLKERQLIETTSADNYTETVCVQHDDCQHVESEAITVEEIAPCATPCTKNTRTSDAVTVTNIPSTGMIIGGANAAEQFLKPGEIYDVNTGTRIKIYHNDRGDYGLHTDVGTTNVRVSTNAASVFNFIRVLGDWLCDSDDNSANIYNNYEASPKKTPEQKEELHQWCLQRLKDDLVQKIPQWDDAWLQRREEIVQGWRGIQVKAIRTYNTHLAVAQTPERKAHLTEAKRSAEQHIENFDAELDIIQQEKEARAHKHATSKNTQSSDADTNCNSASPGGKDPRNKDKNKRYDGTKYANMNEVFKKEKIGKRLQECSERIEGEKFKGAQVYRVKKDMLELGLYENDTFYLDSQHGEHIEAFKGNREGTPRNVLSVDGRSLLDKLKKAIKDGRTYRPSK